MSEFGCLDVEATQSGFARLVGAQQPTINQRIKDGKLPATGTYRQWLTIYIDGLRDEASGRIDVSAQDVRKRKELAQAMREELELSKEYKLIVPVDAVASDLAEVMKTIRSQILEAGNIAIQAIESEHAINIDDDIVLAPLRSALGNIAGGAGQLVSRITGRPSAAVPAADYTDGAVDRRKPPASVGE